VTHGESRRRSEAPGYAIRLDWHEGNQLYLADWDRKPDRHVTPFPAAARWFATLAEATSTARLLDMISGEKWIATTIPADARPCRCKAHVHDRNCYDDSEPGREAQLICNGGLPWATYEVGPEDDGLTDEENFMAAHAAVDAVFPELDDDDADLIAASLTHPGARPTVAGGFVP
jgi:hypothetical protein